MPTTRRKPFDPEKSDDPVANKTEWPPASGGGASFRTHGLVVRGERAVFRASLGMLSFAGVFFSIAMVFIVLTPKCVGCDRLTRLAGVSQVMEDGCMPCM